MKRTKKIIFGLVAIVGLLAGGFVVSSMAAKAHTNYKITKVKNADMMTVIGDGRDIYSDPVHKKTKVTNNTNDLANKEVNVVKKYKNHFQTLYQIKRAGKVYGWVSSLSLKKPSEYILPYKYVSQLYPTYAPSGCEAASLQMALSTKGLAQNVSYKKFLDGIPRNDDPKKGYDANPYKKGAGATIYASALKKYAEKYGAQASDITGASEKRLVQELKRGNPIVFEGSFQMQNSDSSHVLALLGYRNGQFLVADPYRDKSDDNKTFWIDNDKFMQVYNKRDKLALVITN